MDVPKKARVQSISIPAGFAESTFVLVEKGESPGDALRRYLASNPDQGNTHAAVINLENDTPGTIEVRVKTLSELIADLDAEGA
jgi:hypothetical protein